MNPREKEILDQAVEVLKNRLHPSKIFLFGSRAKHQSQKGSDFDLAVDSPKPELRIQRQIREAIEEFSGLYKVDVVYLDHVDQEFREIILKTGKVIYEKRN